MPCVMPCAEIVLRRAGREWLNEKEVGTWTTRKRQDLEKRLGNWILKHYSTQKMDMLFLKIHDLETYAATISCYGDGATECAVKAFGNANENKIILEKNLSRKAVVRLLQPQIKKWAGS